jgi:hypothetical protein
LICAATSMSRSDETMSALVSAISPRGIPSKLARCSIVCGMISSLAATTSSAKSTGARCASAMHPERLASYSDTAPCLGPID